MSMTEWALKQAVFFTASAPLTGRPATSFSILSPNLCAYVDATGSGIETVSHILENGRVTIMFCSFETSPRIMRLFCTGRVVEWNEPGFEGWLKRMGNKTFTGMRAVIVLDVLKVSFQHLEKEKNQKPSGRLSGMFSFIAGLAVVFAVDVMKRQPFAGPDIMWLRRAIACYSI
jgi:hypothetical protein